MFGVASDTIPSAWAAQGQGAVDFIEALSYEGDTVAASHNFRTGHLQGPEIEQWLTRTNRYAIPPYSPSGGRLTGGLRLLLCERQQYTPLDFQVEQSTFNLLQRTFHLPASTLAVFDSDAGSYCKNLFYEDAARTKLKRIGIVIKAPQKREICNYGLSMSYDVSTKFTTALLYGTEVPSFQSKVPIPSSNTSDPKIGLRAAQVTAQQPTSDVHHMGPPPERTGLQFIMSPDEKVSEDEDFIFVKLLKESSVAWAHPLLLPSILLAQHILRTKQFCNRGKVMQETWAIEGELGVTYVGRKMDDTAKQLQKSIETNIGALPMSQRHTASRFNRDKDQSWSNKVSLERGKAEELTVRINTQSLRILFTARSPQWNRECSSAMRDLLDKLSETIPTQLEPNAHDSLAEILEYNITTGESVGSHVESMKERMALQLDVLYSMVAQIDNRLSARLAASAGRDSTSMKILAFITALYLPGSFVSGMFSMGMFSWPHTGTSSSGSDGTQNNENVLSDDFWVYWATALPLTAITLIGWGVWWLFEMRQFRKSYAEALGEQKDPVDKVLEIAEQKRRSFRSEKTDV